MINKMRIFYFREIVDRDLPDWGIITKETKQETIKSCVRTPCGDVRIAMGMFYTTKEYEAIRNQVLSTPLP